MRISRSHLHALFAVIMLGLPPAILAEISEDAARQQAVALVRTELNLRPAQFLGIKRDDHLEEILAVATGGKPERSFIYTLSPEGYEFTDKATFEHSSTEGNAQYVVAVDRRSDSWFTIHGFKNSVDEFRRLILALNIKVLDPNQAELLARFYQEVNPEQLALTPVSDLLDLKQAAERQCQSVPFDPEEKSFEAWWKNAKSLYRTDSFEQTTTRDAGEYAVEWVVLSSPGGEFCGGVPLRAKLTIESDGTMGRITFHPLRREN